MSNDPMTEFVGAIGDLLEFTRKVQAMEQKLARFQMKWRKEPPTTGEVRRVQYWWRRRVDWLTGDSRVSIVNRPVTEDRAIEAGDEWCPIPLPEEA